MAIDIGKAIAAAVVKHGPQFGRVCGERELLHDILHRRSLTDFKVFFDFFAGSDDGDYLNMGTFPELFGPWWMAHLEAEHLVWVYDHLVNEYESLDLLGKFVADRRIAPAKRALLYHGVLYCPAPVSRYRDDRGVVTLPELWWDNHGLWAHYTARSRKDHPELFAFTRRRGLASGRWAECSPALERAMKKDSVSDFELTRKLENRPVGDGLMKCLLGYDASRCFVHLMANHPERVFKLRSPEEWLFTVCREAPDKLGAAAVVELERQFPGIVRRTRDPWGNTPLWDTLFSMSTEKLQAELIRFGCDPDEENKWGLSFRLVRDNDPENSRTERLSTVFLD